MVARLWSKDSWNWRQNGHVSVDHMCRTVPYYRFTVGCMYSNPKPSSMLVSRSWFRTPFLKRCFNSGFISEKCGSRAFLSLEQGISVMIGECIELR